jgi:hypothetical protein
MRASNLVAGRLQKQLQIVKLQCKNLFELIVSSFNYIIRSLSYVTPSGFLFVHIHLISITISSLRDFLLVLNANNPETRLAARQGVV